MNLTKMLSQSGYAKTGLHHRYNPLNGNWHPANHARGQRPNMIRNGGDACPFCVENIEEAGRILVDQSQQDVGGFVLKNKWPMADGPIRNVVEGEPAEGGAAELIVPTRHITHTTDLTIEETAWMLRRWIDRIRLDRGSECERYGVGFMGEGPGVGATIPHLHAQAVTFGYPVDVYRREHSTNSGGCVLCEVSEFEISRGDRLIAKQGDVVAWVPWWMDVNHEVLITGDSHKPFPDTEIGNLSVVVNKVAKALTAVTGSVSRRWGIHGSDLLDIHWHMHVFSPLGQYVPSPGDVFIGSQNEDPVLFAGALREAISDAAEGGGTL